MPKVEPDEETSSKQRRKKYVSKRAHEVELLSSDSGISMQIDSLPIVDLEPVECPRERNSLIPVDFQLSDPVTNCSRQSARHSKPNMTNG